LKISTQKEGEKHRKRRGKKNSEGCKYVEEKEEKSNTEMKI
jgi:hypothetical protein